MKFSIVTVTYNSREFIRDCLESVCAQRWHAVEHVIVDNCSTDGTLDLAHRYSRPGRIVISEPDSGIYNAMNKGLSVASGDVVAFLNADDYYSSSAVLDQVAGGFADSGADIVVGRIAYVPRLVTLSGQPVRHWSRRADQVLKFKGGWHPPHPGFFVTKESALRCGGFNERLRVSADYELMLRYLLRCRCSSVFLDSVLVLMRVGGVSNASARRVIMANWECLLAWRMNSLRPPLSLVLKPIVKLFCK